MLFATVPVAETLALDFVTAAGAAQRGSMPCCANADNAMPKLITRMVVDFICTSHDNECEGDFAIKNSFIAKKGLTVPQGDSLYLYKVNSRSTVMNIHEIVQKTGLTKKAINYYEKKGLIAPEYNPDSDYRIFSEQDFTRLAVIALLRQLDFPTEKIRLVLDGKISIADLLRQRLRTIDADMESLRTEKEIIGSFLDRRPITQLDEAEPEEILKLKSEIELNQFTRQNYLQSQGQKIFPGNLGRLFSLIYNAHLAEPIDTPDKREAWTAFVEQLDQIEEIDISDDIRSILDSEMFETQMLALENDYRAAILHLGSLDKKRLEEEMPAPLPTGIDALPPEKIELVRRWLKISAFVREELGERLAPLKKHLAVLSNSYNKAAQNISFMNDILHEQADYKPLLELFDRLRNEVKR